MKFILDANNITIPDEFGDVTDFYIPVEAPEQTILFPGTVQIEEKPEFLEIVGLMNKKAQEHDGLEFSMDIIKYGDKHIFRGHSIDSVQGKIFIFRRLPSFIPSIDEIGMPRGIVELLSHKRLNHGGLVIIAGETGQGKSTTAAATIAYRMQKFGSFCLTIENPVEMPLQGFYPSDSDEQQQGVCFQTDVKDEDILEAIKSSLRCYPSVSNSILFLGETRDANMAAEVLTIAANGHLVITTMHGSDLVTSLKRFLSLAVSSGKNTPEEVYSIFSSVFRLIIHQRMEKTQSGEKRIRPVVLFSKDASSIVSSRIKSNKIEMLTTEIFEQNKAILTGRPIDS